jgi:hypothetical protein
MNKNALTINLNIVFFLYCFVFYLFGVFTPNLDNNFLFFIINFFILIIIVNLLIFSSTKKNLFVISIKKNDFFILLYLFIFVVLINSLNLNNSIITDGYAYLNYSFIHSYEIVNFLSKTTDYFDEFEYRNILRLVNIVLILCTILSIFLISKINISYKLILIIVIFCLCRYFIAFIGGNEFPHSPFVAFHILLTSLIFGLSNLTVQLSNLGLFTFFLFCIYLILKEKFDNKLNLFLILLTIASIPLNIFLSSMTDHSLFGFAATTIIMLLILIQKTNDRNLFNTILLISFLSLIRIPVIFLLLPLIIKVFLDGKKNLILKNIYSYTSILLPVLPFFIFNNLYRGNRNDTIQIFDLILNGYLFETIYKTVSPLWILFFIIFIFIFNLKKLIVFYSGFFILLFIFFSIDTNYLPFAKYKSEFFLPFCIISFILLSIKYFPKINKKVFSIFLITTIFLNLSFYIFYLDKLISTDFLINNYEIQNKEPLIYRKILFNYNNVYDYIIKNNLENKTISLDINYGLFPEIINGYTIKNINYIKNEYFNYKIFHQKNNKYWTSASENYFLSNSKIKYLIIGYVFPNRDKILNNLYNNGWNLEKVFHNKMYDSSVYLLKKQF